MKMLKSLLPKRTKLSNKTDGGKVLIIGGGKGLYGAGILAALSATRSGAGYTHLMTDLSKFPWIKFPDFIVHPIKVSELKNKMDFAVGIGPGLGINSNGIKLINYLLKHDFKKVVVDADGLTLIARHQIKQLPPSWILTPHEGELARLLNIKSNLVKNNREKYLKMAVDNFNCIIILKGHKTLIATPETKKVITLTSGTPALSKAGTGDVLLGIITAFLAQGLSASEACYLAVGIHGLAAKLWKKDGMDDLSLRPTDLIERLPRVLLLLRSS
jgi:NAD(P)H-hydrate epimerase